ncbi:molecular chaperone [Pseudomonas granadensis]|uniref:molecular chaperone n=1 Tax=Pseudomonas granadensis TaxID=1421430 RepID=UPI0019D1D8C0|nr:molecular chaperone [Pseudomonas granadensis]MBN6773869.1 molecular chaperone [Pseudomonas granadensis]MBN6804268.1 molecular chaperone [Pseudomonas granadensis]MBN6831414.1 molecular chaperone [Pseudomonas granadensis]MBN6838943.1 molecular chaperone [Pseudomonas granadensis]MBN6868441.1 molecular chaperone [Pseudomonas granadensis]
MNRGFLLGVLSLFCLTAQAGPQINVGTVYDYLDADKSTYLKRVFNSGDATAFVKVDVLEIVYGTDGSPQEIAVENAADGASRNGLMASPARLIVPAQGMQGTRLLYMGERDRERYFRVRFVPVVPEKEDEFVVSNEEREDYKSSLSAGVNVMTGFGTIFFVRPKDARFDTAVKETESRYELRNNGNTVIIIDEFKNCSLTKDTDCGATTKHHVLAGKSFAFDKEKGREYRFFLIEGADKKTVKIASR